MVFLLHFFPFSGSSLLLYSGRRIKSTVCGAFFYFFLMHDRPRVFMRNGHKKRGIGAPPHAARATDIS